MSFYLLVHLSFFLRQHVRFLFAVDVVLVYMAAWLGADVMPGLVGFMVVLSWAPIHIDDMMSVVCSKVHIDGK
jgi:hypothetical protein